MYKGTLQLLLLGCVCVSILQSVSGDDWWENANFYQVYPRSFHDSDGDGVGDLKGITQRLDYLAYLGIDGIWLSPIFPSPMKDFGYDITDYRGIHHEYGTMADFDELLHRCHELNIKLVLDFVPNHSSDQHEWFVASSDPAHPDHDKYKDFYVWHDGNKAANGTVVGPPSNWLSIFRRSAWTFHPKRKQYYLHQFLPAQPDLNFRLEAVRMEMEDVLRFWYDKKVDGFRIDAIPFMFESEENPETGRYDDEPPTGWCLPDEHCSLKHVHTSNVNETYELVYQWRKVSDSYKENTRILMTESYTALDENMRYYGDVINNEYVEGAQVPFNFEFMCRTRPGSNATEFENTLWGWLNGMPKRPGVHANWVLGNHDQKRFTTKYGPPRTDLFNILLKTLPGISITYYGEEIGMTNVYISWEETVDPQACRTNPQMFDGVSRDPSRTPLQWDASPNAGFSTAARTWLPISVNYTTCNIAQQKEDKYSHLKVFKSLLELRDQPAMRYGELTTNVYGEKILVYKRELVNETTGDVYFFIMNFGRKKVSVPLASLLEDVPAQLRVIIASIHSDSLIPGRMVSSSFITIDPEVGAAFVGRKESKHQLPHPQWWRESHKLSLPRKLKGSSATSAHRT